MNCITCHWPEFGWDDYCHCFWSDDRTSSADDTTGSSTTPSSSIDSQTECTPLGDTQCEHQNHQSSAKPKSFSKLVRSVLRRWFREHEHHPHPTSADLDYLVETTRLSRRQITTWLSNARSRQKPRLTEVSIAHQSELESSLLPTTQNSLNQLEDVSQLFEQLNPFERWRANVNLTCEAATPSAIASAVADLDAHSNTTEGAHDVQPPYSCVNGSATTESAFEDDSIWGDSMQSSITAITSVGSTSTGGFVKRPLSNNFKNRSNTAKITPSRSSAVAFGGVQRRRCKAKESKTDRVSPASNRFHCTFCKDRSFKTKYDWERHETSQHMTTENWTCCLFGGTMRVDDQTICAFCGHADPDSEHIESHNYSACQDKDLMYKTFYRKDHLTQHLKLVHDTSFQPWMGDWKASCSAIESTCGFCAASLKDWKSRATHLASHFKDGMTMQQWHGPLGLLPFPPRAF